MMKVVLSQPALRSENIFENFAYLADCVRAQASLFADADVLVLPELVGATSTRADYHEQLTRLSKLVDCVVVGGSHHEVRAGVNLNCGLVVDPAGEVLAEYEKLRPYGSEISHRIAGGIGPCYFNIGATNVCVLICSDLWFSSIFSKRPTLPQLILCPSCSITQRSEPAKPQNLWKHMAVSRAYEFAAYVGVSDWAHPCEYDGLQCCGTSGMADPWPRLDSYFEPVGEEIFTSYTLDFERLANLRGNRIERGFLHEFSS